jgi:hypothetical protein
MLQQSRIARYVGESFSAHVEQAYVEGGGKAFTPAKAKANADEHDRHAQMHQAERVATRQ